MAIPNQTKAFHHVGSVLEDIPMGVRSQDFVHVAFMFENLYSDPIAAIEREYSTNAWDSHVFAGNPNPIEVTLPTEANLFFTVQDYGVGMSIDQIRNIYANYGASDKRETNAVAGQLGMGSKSALSYAPMFLITAVRNGVKVEAMSTKDENGLGVLKIKDTRATDEPNGVRITVPVDRWDVSRFREAAKDLFQFWQPGTVLIDGEPPAVPVWRANALPLDDWDHTLLIRPEGNSGLWSSYVVMGNVPYPVEDADLGYTSVRFVAQLNISDVDFAPSREDVRHTAHTDKTLSDLNEWVKASYKRAIDKTLANAQSRWEETMLKAVWMDRNITVRGGGNPIWTFTPDAYSRKARSHLTYRVDYISQPNVVVVTNFPNKNVSAQARDRLVEFIDGAVDRPVFVILPTSAIGIGMLDGHPHLHTWDEIVGATVDPVTKKDKVKREKYETRYSLAGTSASMTAAELAEVDGKVLYLLPNEYARHGHLDCTVVALRSSNQIGRLMRFVPGIKAYESEVNRRTKAAEVGITDHDRKIVRARTLPDAFHGLDPDDVLDPDLAEALRLRKEPDTPTMIDANKFGVAIKVKSLAQEFTKRYPLTGSRSSSYSLGVSLRVTKDNLSDFLLYVNAKYDALTKPDDT